MIYFFTNNNIENHHTIGIDYNLDEITSSGNKFPINWWLTKITFKAKQ